MSILLFTITKTPENNIDILEIKDVDVPLYQDEHPIYRVDTDVNKTPLKELKKYLLMSHQFPDEYVQLSGISRQN